MPSVCDLRFKANIVYLVYMYIVRHLCNFTDYSEIVQRGEKKTDEKTDETMTEMTYHLQHTHKATSSQSNCSSKQSLEPTYIMLKTQLFLLSAWC